MRRISLASGVLPEFDAPTVAQCARQAGYSDAGLMVRPDAWDVAWEDQIQAQIEQGIGILDVEVLWIPPGGQLDAGHELIIDVGNRLQADHLLVVSDEPDADKLAGALTAISQRCHVSGMRPCLEFLRITQVTSLQQARELLEACQEHNFGILIDTLHLQRCNGFTTFTSFDRRLYPYVQLCDGNLVCGDEPQRLLEDALDLRSAPGQGELPLRQFMQLLPADLPLSLEVRSAALREQYPEPLARAQALLQQTQSFLGEDS